MERIINIKGKNEKIEPICSIDKDYFRKEFILNKDIFSCYYENYSRDFNWKRHTFTSYHLFNEFFNDSVTAWGNKDHITSVITFNYHEFIIKIQNYLNIKNIVGDDDISFKTQIKERISTLKTISSEDRLADEFPILYNIFIEGNKKENYIPSNYYYNCGLRYIVPYYAIEQAKYFENALNNLDRIKDSYIKYSITKDAIKNNIDRDKFKLYLAHRVFDNLVNNPNINNISNSLEILNNYFNDNTVNIHTVVTLENNYDLSYVELLSHYSKYIHGGSIQTWDIAPQGHDKTKVFHEPTNFNRMSDAEFNRLVKLNKEKYDFYENLPYLVRAKGKYINNGYYAFFLPNGEQILDKLCYPDDPFIVSHYGNSIFNLNIKNFELLSHVDKTNLRKNNLCPHTTHQGAWQERVTRRINSIPTTPTSIDESKKLIKRIEIKS